MTFLLGNYFLYGIRGTANARLTNYLTNINQYVIADDHYLNFYYSPTTQIYSVLAPAYMTYETLSIGSWLNCLCGSRLIDYHYIWGKQTTCCSAVDRLTMS